MATQPLGDIRKQYNVNNSLEMYNKNRILTCITWIKSRILSHIRHNERKFCKLNYIQNIKGKVDNISSFYDFLIYNYHLSIFNNH
jgi:hypothetical protein